MRGKRGKGVGMTGGKLSMWSWVRGGREIVLCVYVGIITSSQNITTNSIALTAFKHFSQRSVHTENQCRRNLELRMQSDSAIINNANNSFVVCYS